MSHNNLTVNQYSSCTCTTMHTSRYGGGLVPIPDFEIDVIYIPLLYLRVDFSVCILTLGNDEKAWFF